MKKLYKRVAKYFVILYANRIYNNRVKLADKLHSKNRTRYYVALDYSNSKNLLVMNRKGFRNLKRIFQIYDPAQGTLKLKEGAFYFTPDAKGNGPLLPVEKEARRLAFVKYMLDRARL